MLKLLMELTALTEMPAAKVCPNCGVGPMSKTHTWNLATKGWRCKKANVDAFHAAGGTPAGTPGPITPPTTAAPVTGAPSSVSSTTSPTAPPPAPPSAASTPQQENKLEQQWTDWLTEFGDGIGKIEFVDNGSSVKLTGKKIMFFGTAGVKVGGDRVFPLNISEVTGTFVISGSALTSLKRCPTKVGGSYLVPGSEIKNLIGAPEEVPGDFSVSLSDNLESLEGSPIKVGQSYSITETPIKSLHKIHKQVKYIGGSFLATQTAIESHCLGLLLIRGLQEVTLPDEDVARIINKHLKHGRDVNLCQEELIEAGFSEYARL